MAEIIRLPVVEKARKKAGKPEPVAYQWTCKRCAHDIGVATSEIMQVRIGPLIKGLKVVGGYKRWVCSRCYTRNVVTPVLL